MPKTRPNKDTEAFGARLVALLEARGHARHGAGAYLHKKYGATAVSANAWLNGQHKCNAERAKEIAKDHGATFEWLYVGIGPAPDGVDLKPQDGRSAMPPGATPTGIFTKEQRASDDVTALRIGLESLFLAVLRRVPGAASAFLDDAEALAMEAEFSTKSGYLGELVRIARQVHRTEEAAAQARQRAGSAASTTRGKRDQARS